MRRVRGPIPPPPAVGVSVIPPPAKIDSRDLHRTASGSKGTGSSGAVASAEDGGGFRRFGFWVGAVEVVVDGPVPALGVLVAFALSVAFPLLEAFAVGDDPGWEFRVLASINGQGVTPTHEAGCSEKAALFRGGYVGRGVWRWAYEIRWRVLLAVIQRFSGRIDTRRQQPSDARSSPTSLGPLTRPPCEQR